MVKNQGNTTKKKGGNGMKNTKKIAFLCVAINIILLLQLCFGNVIALEEDAVYVEPEQVVEEAVIESQGGGEMQIMAAATCAPTIIATDTQYSWWYTSSGEQTDYVKTTTVTTHYSDGSTTVQTTSHNYGTFSKP